MCEVPAGAHRCATPSPHQHESSQWRHRTLPKTKTSTASTPQAHLPLTGPGRNGSDLHFVADFGPSLVEFGGGKLEIFGDWFRAKSGGVGTKSAHFDPCIMVLITGKTLRVSQSQQAVSGNGCEVLFTSTHTGVVGSSEYSSCLIMHRAANLRTWETLLAGRHHTHAVLRDSHWHWQCRSGPSKLATLCLVALGNTDQGWYFHHACCFDHPSDAEHMHANTCTLPLHLGVLPWRKLIAERSTSTRCSCLHHVALCVPVATPHPHHTSRSLHDHTAGRSHTAGDTKQLQRRHTNT